MSKGQPLSPLPSRKTTKVNNKDKVKSSKRTLFLRAALGALLVLLLAVGAIMGYYYVKVKDTIDDITIKDNVAVPSHELASQKPLTILLLGVDSRGKLGLLNTDIIMAISMNPNRKTATLVSIPRDTYMKPTGYRDRKANAFYSVAYHENKDTALSTVQKWFGEFLDLSIDYTVLVNFKTLEDMVDALGGIQVYVDKDMEYVDNADGTHINLKAGDQLLDGKNALDFVRYRQSNRGTAASSDIERNERQQLVISKMVEKIKSPTVIFKGGGLLDAIGNNVQTNIPAEQLRSLVTTYAGISNQQITYIHLNGKWESPYMYLNQEEFKSAKEALNLELQQTDRM